MAEVLGVALGCLSLVEQIVDSIDKLKGLRAFVKSAPTEFQNLIDEIEMIQVILTSLEPEMLGSLNLPSTERRLRAFQNTLESVVSTIQKYKHQTTKGKLGTIKLALKKESLQAHKQELERMKGTLLLLQQAYYSTSLRDLTLKIDSSIPSKNSTTSEPCIDQEKCLQSAKYPSSRQRGLNRRTFRFRTPLAFMDKLWTIDICRGFSNFAFSIQANNVLPSRSPIFLHCQSGNIAEIQNLFTNRLASPFDCNSYGESLLHVAAQHRQLGVCQMLLDNGANPGQRDNWGATPFGVVNTSARDWIDHPETVSLTLELYRLFARDFGDELFEDLDKRIGETSGFQGPPQALSLIQEYSFRSYSELPLDFRFKRAMTLDTWWVRCASPTTLRIAMGGDHIDPAAFLLKNDDGETLLYHIVTGMAVDFSSKRTNNIHQWRQLLSDAIAASADPCHLTFRLGRAFTPFVQFLFFFTKNWAEIRRARYNFNPIVQLWASELKLAGVDLVTYGAKEKALWTSGVVDPDQWIYVGLERSGPAYNPRLGGFLHFHFLSSLEYSPDPGDWKVWISNPMDEMAGEFWEMIEKKEEVMPGTWID